MPKSRSAQSSRAFDQHIAGRIRVRRLMLGMSQETLGAKLGVTFQQVQKYEKGTNRVSGGRLWEIAKFFEIPVGWFFDEMPGGEVVPNGASQMVSDVLRDAATARIAKAFGGIRDPGVRSRIVGLVEAVANSEDAKA